MESNFDDREYWIDILLKIADPILVNISKGTLKKNMLVESVDEDKVKFAYLEAVGRLICGIAPWLELGVDDSSEGKLRGLYIDLIKKGLVNITNPDSDDYLLFDAFYQPLVDSAFLAEGILRAKTQLWDNMDESGKRLILNAFKKTRSINPSNNNWLLFASMIEAFFLETTGKCDENRLNYGVNKFLNEWYCGDGHYRDGYNYHFDYYNSFVIHPMLTDILLIMNKNGFCDDNTLNLQLNRLKHYASQLERLISPEGTYPIIGRSMSYRTGIFHALGEACLLGLYDDEIVPEQIRSALTKVIKKQFSDNNNFTKEGWLKLGFNGEQIRMGENYINTGSLYLCSTIFLPLGLSKDNRFWKAPNCEWTSVKGWKGNDICRMGFINDSNQRLNNKFIKYNRARIDMINRGLENNTIKIINNSDIFSTVHYPDWLKKEYGVGCVVQSDNNSLFIELKCIGDGNLDIILRGSDVKDSNKNRIPIYIKYTNFLINETLIFEDEKLICHDSPYRKSIPVTNGEIVKLYFEWEPF